MTTQLELYNKALVEYLGERKIASLTVREKSRYVLDGIYGSGPGDSNGVIDFCLQAGNWTEATRTVRLDYDATIDPDFGFKRVFAHPDDFVEVVEYAMDEYFSNTLTDANYSDEGGYFYSNYDTIYVRYVSNDPQYGGNMNAWPPAFVNYVAAEMAARAAKSITGSESKAKDARDMAEKMLGMARGTDAKRKPAKIQPPGRLVGARFGGIGLVGTKVR
jgi:hypothetical protein